MGRIQHRALRTKTWHASQSEYSAFDVLDGEHSWQSAMPGGYVSYPARKLNTGSVIYFNYALAKEMGLIPAAHAGVMNKALEKKILDTFSIRIINEYDQKQNIKYHPAMLKKKPYMATRYLQLQHPSKRGETSGDGRSVWNGEVEHNGVVWDVSSRGTGVTKLSPGMVEAKKPLRSGSTRYGYGCGLADVDELVGAAILAEIFHNNGINTERVLAVIDLGDGNGIGVRAGKNLFRPAHLFTYLKQGQYESLQRATDYLIDRQFKNKEWTFNSSNKRKYDLLLKEVSESFAYFAAQLDRDYIFAWLDWDGDNVLTNAGIIDYGSIRQFGLRHDAYRYDDVDRFSTNLNEQKIKARQIVQVFAQLVDYLKTKIKKPIQHFNDHVSTREFDDHFDYYLHDYFLKQVGLSRLKREALLKSNRELVKKFYANYSTLERTKTQRKVEKVPDGVNRPAIFNMRNILSDLPQFMRETLMSGSIEMLPTELFFTLILAETARGRDRKLTPALKKKIREFQNIYWEVMARSTGNLALKAHLKNVCGQAREMNRTDRMTGDGLLYVVDEIMKFKKKNKNSKTIQTVIDGLIAEQSLKQAHFDENEKSPLHANRRETTLLKTMLTLVDGNKESI
jgi:hypothetical protein